MKTLPKLSEYVKLQFKLLKQWKISEQIFILNVQQFTEFLTQSLNLSHFVPSIEKDGKWIVLEEPQFNTENEYDEYERNLFCSKLEEYQTALDNVVFKGFEIDYDNIVINRNSNNRLQFNDYSIYFNVSSCVVKTIEDLIPYNLEVNETIIKKFGL